MCGALQDFTGIRSGAFMLLYAIVWVSLICMYWTEVRKTEVMGLRSPASPLAAQSSSGAAHLLVELDAQHRGESAALTGSEFRFLGSGGVVRQFRADEHE